MNKIAARVHINHTTSLVLADSLLDSKGPTCTVLAIYAVYKMKRMDGKASSCLRHKSKHDPFQNMIEFIRNVWSLLLNKTSFVHQVVPLKAGIINLFQITKRQISKIIVQCYVLLAF